MNKEKGIIFNCESKNYKCSVNFPKLENLSDEKAKKCIIGFLVDLYAYLEGCYYDNNGKEPMKKERFYNEYENKLNLYLLKDRN